MSPKMRAAQFLVCDPNTHTRRLVADVLAGAGFDRLQFAVDGAELLRFACDRAPRVVITSSRIPGISGLDFTRKVRAGFGGVERTLSIIVMTDTPTQKFLDAARAAGVDEMLVRPFTGAALLARVEAVLLRPRRFVASAAYTGPCRRRRMLEEYGGPLRRCEDAADADAPWEAEANRALMRQGVARIAAVAAELAPGDRGTLRDLFGAVRDVKRLAEEVCDDSMAAAARSLARYISANEAIAALDGDVLSTHIDAMDRLGGLGSSVAAAREEVVNGLVAVVNKRLGQKAPTGARAA